MSERNSTLVIIAAAVVLAGLGHYFVMYVDIYPRDPALFYAAAVLLLIWAYARAVATSERRLALTWSAVERLIAALRGLFLRVPGRPLVGLLLALNVVAGLMAYLAPAESSWRAELLVVLLWLMGLLGVVLVVLEVAGVRWQRARPAEAPPESAGEPGEGEEDAGPSWRDALRERLEPRSLLIGRILLATGLVFGLLGQYTFFYRRESGHAARDGGIYWVVAIVAFALLAALDLLVKPARPAPQADAGSGETDPPFAHGPGVSGAEAAPAGDGALPVESQA